MNLIGLAVRDNQTEVVEKILRMSPQSINAKDGFGNTALHYAMLKGDDAMLPSIPPRVETRGCRLELLKTGGPRWASGWVCLDFAAAKIS